MKDVSPGFTAKATPSGVQSDLISSETGLPPLSTFGVGLPGPGGAAEAALGPVPGGVQSENSSFGHECLPPLLVNDSSDGDMRNGGACDMPTMLPGAGA